MLKKIIKFFKNIFSSSNNKEQEDSKKNKKKPSKDNYPMW